MAGSDHRQHIPGCLTADGWRGTTGSKADPEGSRVIQIIKLHEFVFLDSTCLFFSYSLNLDDIIFRFIIFYRNRDRGLYQTSEFRPR